jgi:hypothetical protein
MPLAKCQSGSCKKLSFARTQGMSRVDPEGVERACFEGEEQRLKKQFLM